MIRKYLASAGAAVGLFTGGVFETGAITFDFVTGGNVGDLFNETSSQAAIVDGLGIFGLAFELDAAGNFLAAVFNFNDNSAHLGMGINTPTDSRPTQIEVNEGIFFIFDQRIALQSITLQVFFRTSSDGVGGPIGLHNDAVAILMLGSGSAAEVVSPVDFVAGDPTTYTIDVTALGLASDFGFVFAPTQGDGVRLVSFTVATVPDGGATLALLGAGVAALALARRVRNS